MSQQEREHIGTNMSESYFETFSIGTAKAIESSFMEQKSRVSMNCPKKEKKKKVQPDK